MKAQLKAQQQQQLIQWQKDQQNSDKALNLLVRTPVRLFEEKEHTSNSPFLTDQAQLSTIFETASAVLQSLVKEFFDDADKTFEDEDFKHLFSAEIL